MLLLIIIVTTLVNRSLSFNIPWTDGYDVRQAIPRDVIVDLINNFGLELLNAHNEHNNNNIAISPYGAASVLIAIVEGVRGGAHEEIRRALRLPIDKSVVRVGLRDVHRHLKSYFIPKEGFLAGLTLSHDNVTLTKDFEDILKFYGYDIESFNSPLYTDFEEQTTTNVIEEEPTETSQITTTQRNRRTTIKSSEEEEEISTMEMEKSTTRAEEKTTRKVDGKEGDEMKETNIERPIKNGTIEADDKNEEATTKSTTMIEKLSSTMVTEAAVESTGVSEEDVKTSTTRETTMATTPLVKTTKKTTTKKPTITTRKSMTTTTRKPRTTTIKTTKTTAATTTAKTATTSAKTATTSAKTATTTVKTATTTVKLTTSTAKVAASTEKAATTIAKTTTARKVETTTIKPVITTSKDTKRTSTTKSAKPSVTTTTTSEPITTTISAMTTTLSTIETEETTILTSTVPNEDAKTSKLVSPLVLTQPIQTTTLESDTSTEEIVSTTTTETPIMTTEITTTEEVKTEEPTTTIVTTTLEPTTQTTMQTSKAEKADNKKRSTKPKGVPSKFRQTKAIKKSSKPAKSSATADTAKTTNLTEKRRKRSAITLNSKYSHSVREKRSVVDYVIARYYDNYYVTNKNNNKNYNQQSMDYNSNGDNQQFSFLTNGNIRLDNINYMTYDTILPFTFVPNLNAIALGFPLDNIKYYLLLLLPIEEDGVDKLIVNLNKLKNLNEIISNLKYARVKATIPSFMLKGYVVLTPTLQKLGINRIFEPRQADFSPMTIEKDTYVTNMEQAITVTIRNYVDPKTLMNNSRNLHQYGTVEFKADHPFLYFVIDSDIHVTLMAGKIINPLNSRIR